MSDRSPENEEQAHSGPTVRDNRRIDPETGQVREPRHAAPAPAGGDDAATEPPVADESVVDSSGVDGSVGDEVPAESAASSAEADQLKAALADRTADLQRLQAEYVNYKRRVDRDRDVSRSNGVESVLKDLLSVLDNVRSAREHEELSQGFRAVAEEIERVTAKFGLVAFGAVGDAFDPQVHEALMHSAATEVDGVTIEGPTCVTVLQAGYKIGERVVRPARVAVAEPS